MTIYCFGNEDVIRDSMAKKIGRLLDDVVFCNSPEDMFDMSPKPPIFILDVAAGAKSVVQLKISDLKVEKIYSLHDFDLAYFLTLMMTLGNIKEDDIKIIGVPETGDPKKLAGDVKLILGNS